MQPPPIQEEGSCLHTVIQAEIRMGHNGIQPSGGLGRNPRRGRQDSRDRHRRRPRPPGPEGQPPSRDECREQEKAATRRRRSRDACRRDNMRHEQRNRDGWGCPEIQGGSDKSTGFQGVRRSHHGLRRNQVGYRTGSRLHNLEPRISEPGPAGEEGDTTG